MIEKEITQGIKIVKKFVKENANLDMQIKNKLATIMKEKNRISNAKKTYEQKWKNWENDWKNEGSVRMVQNDCEWAII